MNTQEINSGIKPGEFPFPLTGTNRESPFLTWLRNHSMYMVSRGLLGYFRFAAVLMRGIIINSLAILPPLLIGALIVSLLYANLLYDWRDQSTYELTEVRLALDAVEKARRGLATRQGTPHDAAAATPADAVLQQAKQRLAVARSAEKEHNLDRAQMPIRFFLSRKSVFADSGWVLWMQDHLGLTPPFLLTPLAFALALVWVVLFPIVTMLTRIAGYNRTLATGSDSSVRIRDQYERTFGVILFAALAIAVFEMLPVAVHFFHQIRKASLDDSGYWNQYLIAVTAICSALSGAPKLLSVLSGLKRTLVMALLGLLGLLVPLSVIIMVADFLVYESVPAADFENVLTLFVLPPAVFAAVVLCAITVGLGKRTFSWREYRWLATLLISMIAMPFVLISGLLVVWSLMFNLYLTHPGAVPDILLAVERARGDSWDDYGDLAAYLVLGSALQIWLYCTLTVDINLTAIHSLYRDRLASAFLLGLNRRNEVDIEQDIPLGELCCYASGSTAPYPLINVTLNLQGSTDLKLRDRRSDFFVFTKKYIGGARTGYCRSELMAQVFPQIDLASAMAISAAAASPNMGRSTSAALVAFMTLVNVRLGIWVPNPGLLEEALAKRGSKSNDSLAPKARLPGFAFEEVFCDELVSIKKRWEQLGDRSTGRCLAASEAPTTLHGLTGIAFSGGGIRSATINLGIAQVLHQAGLFDHFDYMSTVSGGGYLGSSISALMRHKTQPRSEIAGTVLVTLTAAGEPLVTVTPAPPDEPRSYRYAKGAALSVKSGDEIKVGTRLLCRPGSKVRSEIAGTVSIERLAAGEQIVRIAAPESGESRDYRYTRYEQLKVKDGDSIAPGDLLVKEHNAFGDRFRWRVRPVALLREMTMRLVETYPWVNLSDGGHIENLATMELLRRRCKLIVIGDCEADGSFHFGGMATLMRTARLDLGVHIDICLDPLCVDDRLNSAAHFAVGRISYPGDSNYGYLLYLKSSCTGDEDEVIREYRRRCTDFPHQSTADQFFDEGQFEAYRSLGQHIAEQAIAALRLNGGAQRFTFTEFGNTLQALWTAADSKRQDRPAHTA